VQGRNAILVAALAFIGILAGLTIVVAVRNGPDVLTVASFLVLAMFAFGIVGALRHPPQQ
jgi:hypothetical protein